MTDVVVSSTRKRLARRVMFLVIVQLLGFFFLVLGLYVTACAPNGPRQTEFQEYGFYLVVFGMLVCAVAACWGSARLMHAGMPFSIRVYALVGCLLAFYCILFLVSLTPLIFVVPFYCTIPQFFIARRLAKEAKDDTMGK